MQARPKPFLSLLAVALFAASGLVWPAVAQDQRTTQTQRSSPGAADSAGGLSELRFVNPRSRIALPEPMPGPVLRFVIADDFPPFAYVDGAGRLAGVHPDLIRRLCRTLDLACTVQARRFDQVLSAIDEDPNDLVLVAGLAVSPENADRLAFSLPYFRFAGRFVGRRTADETEDWTERARIGVIENTTHEAFLNDGFASATIETYEDQAALLQALRRGDVSHIFSDAVDLAFWLASPASGNCCRFFGTPFFSNDYFGNGLTLAVPRRQPQLLQALNSALARLESSGELEIVMLTAFPIDPFGP
ncbi:MAG: transporter substrate-binding domain-containing protein [Pseudomonadota bacterium]